MKIIATSKMKPEFKILISLLGEESFQGIVIESNRPSKKIGYSSNFWVRNDFELKYEDGTELKNEIKSVLLEAESIVNGDRDVQYGDSLKAFTEYSNILETNFGIKLTPSEICKVQMAIKLGRLKYKYKRDSIVDLCGYAEILNRLENGI